MPEGWGGRSAAVDPGPSLAPRQLWARAVDLAACAPVPEQVRVEEQDGCGHSAFEMLGPGPAYEAVVAPGKDECVPTARRCSSKGGEMVFPIAGEARDDISRAGNR